MTDNNPVIRVGGCRRSSTTLTQRALEHNFHVDARSAPPHKHGVLVEVPSLMELFDGYIFTVKNPFAWTQSMLEWQRLTGLTKTQAGLQAVVWQLLGNWGAKNQHYINWRNQHKSKTLIVRAEDWIDQPVDTLKHIQAYFGLAWARETEDGEPKAWTTEEHPSPLPGRGADSFDPDYYREAKYMADLGSLGGKIEERLQERTWLQHVCMELSYPTTSPGWSEWGEDA